MMKTEGKEEQTDRETGWVTRERDTDGGQFFSIERTKQLERRWLLQRSTNKKLTRTPKLEKRKQKHR